MRHINSILPWNMHRQIMSFLSFAPHCTHKMQPLDVSVYGPLKTFFEKEINTFQKRHAGRIIGQADIVKILKPAYLKAASAQNAVSGFRASGIWPFNNNVFCDEDFAPSQLTDRQPEAEACQSPSGLDSTTSVVQALPSSETTTNVASASSTPVNPVTPGPQQRRLNM